MTSNYFQLHKLKEQIMFDQILDWIELRFGRDARLRAENFLTRAVILAIGGILILLIWFMFLKE